MVLPLPIPLSRGLRVRRQEAGGRAASHTAPLEGKLETVNSTSSLPGRRVLPYQRLRGCLVLTARTDQMMLATRRGKSTSKNLYIPKTGNNKKTTTPQPFVEF